MFETSEKIILRGTDVVALFASAAVFVSVLALIVGAMVTNAPKAHAADFAAPSGNELTVERIGEVSPSSSLMKVESNMPNTRTF